MHGFLSHGRAQPSIVQSSVRKIRHLEGRLFLNMHFVGAEATAERVEQSTLVQSVSWAQVFTRGHAFFKHASGF